ncbi:hypothetical protein [Longimicrobium sp.]|uniref:hypothetical protein n=1 Tax=Longimicrobium sp. TaxID=2029185 RepID=UPI002E2EEA72|nr:hypothetical protein [Longimicrobium sp.]HEX6038387.1 hypothetical protein [Longimicrobium sp.]
MTPSPELRASVAVIRDAVTRAVQASSLRRVGDEIDISAMTVRSFIHEGNEPQARTLRKLRAWFADHAAQWAAAGEHEARILVDLLLNFYPKAVHVRVERNFLDERERSFRELGLEPPAWIATLRAELPPSEDEAMRPGVENGPDFR